MNQKGRHGWRRKFMLFAYKISENDIKLACTKCVEQGITQDFDAAVTPPMASHPQQGRLVKCQYCNEPHVLVVPQKAAVTDRKVILSLSIHESLKKRIEERVKSANTTLTALLYPIIVPILEKEFPSGQQTDGPNV